VSYEIFVQRFEHGDAPPMPAAAFRTILGPHVDRTGPEFDFWHIRVADGGEADLYAHIADLTVSGVMVSRFSTGTLLDLVVEFTQAANAVILMPGCPTLLVDEEQRQHLPDELRADALVIATGADVTAALAAC
jgi:hypothetical protein